MKIRHTIGLCIALCWTAMGNAQDFDATLRNVPMEQRKSTQFKLFQPSDLADSTLRKNYVGIRVGANVSNFVGDAAGTSGLVGFRVGILYGRRFNRRASAQIELAYSKQGAQQDESTLQTGILLDSGLTIASKYNYVALPISFKYYPSDNLGLFLEAGARAALLLNAELQGTGGAYASTEDDRIDIAERLNATDIGAFLGVGFSFHQNVDFALRYHYHFTNYIDNAHSLTESSGTFRNALIQATLGFYLF